MDDLSLFDLQSLSSTMTSSTPLNLDTVLFLLTTANSSGTNSTTPGSLTPDQERTVKMTAIICQCVGLVATVLYLLYVIGRSLFTFPYRSLYEYVSGKKLKPIIRIRQISEELLEYDHYSSLFTSASTHDDDDNDGDTHHDPRREVLLETVTHSLSTQTDQSSGSTIVHAHSNDNENNDHNNNGGVSNSNNHVVAAEDENAMTTAMTMTADANHSQTETMYDLDTIVLEEDQDVNVHGDNNNKNNNRMTFREFWRILTSDCYVFSKPLVRIFFLLLFCELFTPTTLMSLLDETKPFNCYLQYLTSQFFNLAKHGWGLMLAVWMMWILAFRKTKSSHLKVLEIVSHFVVWVPTITLTIIPLATRSVGSPEKGEVCWITGHAAIRVATYHGPIAVVVTLVILIYLFTIGAFIWRQCQALRSPAYSKRNKRIALLKSAPLLFKLFGLPLVFAAVSFRRVMFSVLANEYDQLPFSVDMYRAISDGLDGFFYSLLLFISELISLCISMASSHQRKRKMKVWAQQDDDSSNYFIYTKRE